MTAPQGMFAVMEPGGQMKAADGMAAMLLRQRARAADLVADAAEYVYSPLYRGLIVGDSDLCAIAVMSLAEVFAEAELQVPPWDGGPVTFQFQSGATLAVAGADYEPRRDECWQYIGWGGYADDVMPRLLYDKFRRHLAPVVNWAEDFVPVRFDAIVDRVPLCGCGDDPYCDHCTHCGCFDSDDPDDHLIACPTRLNLYPVDPEMLSEGVACAACSQPLFDTFVLVESDKAHGFKFLECSGCAILGRDPADEAVPVFEESYDSDDGEF